MRRGLKPVLVIVNGKDALILQVSKNNKIRDIKNILDNNNIVGNKRFYVNKKYEIPKVFDVDTYDDLRLESVWNKMKDSYITVIPSLQQIQQEKEDYSLTGNIDVDRTILENLDDKNLLIACSVNKYVYNKVCDDKFFQRLVLKRYPGFDPSDNTYSYKYKNWRDKYLNIVRYADLLQRKFNYKYVAGDPKIQFEFFELSKNEFTVVDLLMAVGTNEVEILKYVINALNPIIPGYLSAALSLAISNAHFKVANYLFNSGVKMVEKDILTVIERIEKEDNYIKQNKKFGIYGALVKEKERNEKRKQILKERGVISL